MPSSTTRVYAFRHRPAAASSVSTSGSRRLAKPSLKKSSVVTAPTPVAGGLHSPSDSYIRNRSSSSRSSECHNCPCCTCFRNRECAVCFEKKRLNFAAKPCGHGQVCGDCLDKIIASRSPKCPICHAN